MTHDFLVIGGGAGGLSAARTARRLGKRVALISDGPLGGDCTFTGCVPSKTLIESAAQGLSYDAAIARVHDTVQRIAATESAQVLRHEGIDVLEGRATFTGPGRLDVAGAALSAPHVVIATGSTPLVPAIPGLDTVAFHTSDTIWEVRERPRSLLVLGGGAIGCELAQVFRRFGVDVTIVDSAPRLLPREEPETAEVLADTFRSAGIDLRLGRHVTSVAVVSAGAPGVSATLDDGSVLVAELLLLAVGRTPVTSGLDLARAGVQVDDRGHVVTDERMRTSAPGVFAAGDVTGRLPFTHAADEMGRVAAINAVRSLRLRFHAQSVPWVTFTAPEVARVGLTEAEAAGRNARVAFLPLSAVDRAIAADQTAGFVKLIAGPKGLTRHAGGGRLLGATVVAPRAGEMIAELALAVRTGMFTGRLAQTVHAYPTWSTAVRAAAAQFFVEYDGRRARPARS